MLYKNIEIFNAEELIPNADGSVSWLRVPETVFQAMEGKSADKVACNVTGVELRFVIKGESVKLVMSAKEKVSVFHVYYGGVQGGWEDHEVHKRITLGPQVFEIKRPANMKNLQRMTEAAGWDWDPQVVRVIFDRGRVNLQMSLVKWNRPSPPSAPRRPCFATDLPSPMAPIPLICPMPGPAFWATT